MKTKLIIICTLLLLSIMMIACSTEKQTQSSSTSEKTTATTPVTETTTYTSEKYTETELEPDKQKLMEPFSGGKRTLEKENPNWTGDDIKTAWKMLAKSKVYTEYLDCFFADLNNDNIDELILYDNYQINAFTKLNSKIKLFIAPYDFDIANGVVCKPLTNYKDIKSINYYTFHNLELTRDFRFKKSDDGQFYICGFSSSGDTGNTCWIKKVSMENNAITISTLYRWGAFKEVGTDSMIYVDKCLRYDKNLNVEININEAVSFLQKLYK